MVSGDPVRNDDGRASGAAVSPPRGDGRPPSPTPAQPPASEPDEPSPPPPQAETLIRPCPASRLARWSGLLKVAKAAPQTRPAT